MLLLLSHVLTHANSQNLQRQVLSPFSPEEIEAQRSSKTRISNQAVRLRRLYSLPASPQCSAKFKGINWKRLFQVVVGRGHCGVRREVPTFTVALKANLNLTLLWKPEQLCHNAGFMTSTQYLLVGRPETPHPALRLFSESCFPTPCARTAQTKEMLVPPLL